jgi:PAS domain S-box-containing protein
MDRPDGRRRNVLVVDDDEDFAESVADILSAAGYDAARASSSRDARARAREHPHDVLLVDLRLGREDGADLIRAFRDQSPASISVAMTAYSDPQAVVSALKSGAYDYLAKPFDPQELLATLRRCFERLTLQEERETALRSLEERNRELLEVNARLTRSEQRFRQVFDNSSMGILLLEVVSRGRFRVLSANPAVERITGIPNTTAEGKFIEDLLDEKTAEELISKYQQCVDAGSPISMQRTFELPTGRRAVFTTIIPLRNEVGRIYRVLTLPTDVTDRFSAEEALRESEQRYREIFESTSDGIFMVERTADDRFRLLAYNPAQERMLGIAAAGAVGKFMEEYLPPGIVEPLLADNRACVEAGVPITLERTLDLDDERRYFSTILIPVKDATGHVHRIIGIARDVTDSRRAAEREKEHEQQLFQAAKLATLGTLVSGIAHEINNPNNYIRLNAQNLGELWEDGQLVFDQVAAGDPSFALRGIPYGTARGMIADLLEGIEGGSKRIEKLLLNLRDYARGEQGDMSETVDVNEVVSSAVMLMRDMIDKTTGTFTIQETKPLPLITGNYHQVEQVVINLVTNACQALGARGGGVMVSTALDPEGEVVLLEVADEGVGIPEKDLPRITDPFFTTKRAQGGSGLGLAVSSRIIQNHGGTMQFSSRSDVGTVVSVRFPLPRVQP